MVVSRLPIGERLLPSLVDEYATLEPEKLIASFPTSSKMEGWHEVNYRELSTAVNSLAWFINSKLGKSETFETLGYMGVNDIRYTVVWLAAMKCGYCTLNTSPRNSVEGQVSLLKETGCTKFLYSAEMFHKVDEMKTAVHGNLDIFLIPTYGEILASPDVLRWYPFRHKYHELSTKPALIFHTSGSTGLPKPITLVHGYLATLDNIQVLPVPEGRVQANWTVVKPGQKYFNALPAFHAAGATFNFYAPIFCGTHFVLQPPNVPLNEETFLKIVRQLDLAAALLPPSFLEELSGSPQSFKELSKLPYIFYGGGPLSPGAGDRLNKATNILQMIGGTEAGLGASLINKNWKYFEWNPHYGAEMEQVGDSDLYEMIIRKDPKYAKFHSIFYTFPDLDLWRTRDLFIRDTSDSNLWLFAGRTDDVIVLSNGEKFNPVSMQGHIQDHPLLLSALVIGQGKFQVGLIVEPNYEKWDQKKNVQELIDEIWNKVEEANAFSAATGRVFRNRIMVAPKEKPFKRAGKGTILRAPTIEDFKEEIEALYANIDEETAENLPEVVTFESMKEFVRKCLGVFLIGIEIEDDDDLFTLGMDSLQTMGFANSIRAAVEPALKDKIEADRPTISQKTVYHNPSISKMASFLNSLSNKQPDGINSTNGNSELMREFKISAMVEKYTSDLSLLTTIPLPADQNNLTVILTGTTGSLGIYLLHLLLSSPNISKVYCFNRTPDALTRTSERLSSSGLPLSLLSSSKAEFLHVKFGSPDFGLSSTKYEEITQSVGLVIHNAWAVNFNHTLETFEDPHIKGVRNFLDLSMKSKHRAHVFFISSVGSIGNWAATKTHPGAKSQLVPEEPMADSRAAVPQGYAESKHVSERILAIAAEKACVPSSIARVGQIAGPTTVQGKWNDAEWLPSIIKSSKALSLIPNSLGGMQEGGIDWVPVDKMAKGIFELATGRLGRQEGKKIDIFHLVNPKTSEWETLVPAVKSYFDRNGGEVKVVRYEEWIEALQKVAEKGPSEMEMKEMPALVLLEFFQAMTHMQGRAAAETVNTEANSQTMKVLECITPALMETWLDQWAY